MAKDLMHSCIIILGRARSSEASRRRGETTLVSGLLHMTPAGSQAVDCVGWSSHTAPFSLVLVYCCLELHSGPDPGASQ